MIFILLYILRRFSSRAVCRNMLRCRLERFLNLNGSQDVGGKVSVSWAIRLESIARVDTSMCAKHLLRFNANLFDDVEVKQFGHQIFTMIRFTSTRLESRDRVIYDFINYSFGYLEWWSFFKEFWFWNI